MNLAVNLCCSEFKLRIVAKCPLKRRLKLSLRNYSPPKKGNAKVIQRPAYQTLQKQSFPSLGKGGEGMKYRASSGEKQIEHLKALSNYPHWDFFSSVWLSDKTSGGFHSLSPPGEFHRPQEPSGESLQQQPVSPQAPAFTEVFKFSQH